MPNLASAPRRAAPTAASSEPRGAPGKVAGIVRRDGVPCAARVEALVYRGAIDRMPDTRGNLVAARERGRSRLLRADARVSTVEASADGRYAFDGLPAGVYSIEAYPTKGGAGSGGGYLRAGAAMGVDLDVLGAPVDASLRGRVLHGDGTPWRGVVLVNRAGEVEGSEPGHSPEPARRVEASADGRFSVDGLRPASCR